MKKTVRLIENFKRLASGETIASSSLHGDWIDQMLADGILLKVSRGRHLSYRAADPSAFVAYLDNQWGMGDLDKALALLKGEETDRAEQVKATGNSKFIGQRTMKGFLVNSYEDIPATLAGKSLMIHPQEGSMLFISYYEHFSVPSDVVIVGMENAENFCHVASQRYLFERFGRVLFVCRYPQNKNKDLLCWLLQVSNHYVHFGDFDLAGIHIYLSEFFKYLGPDRSEFFIPDDIASRLRQGSSERYDAQNEMLGKMAVPDARLRSLVHLIHKVHKGYDQEGYIRQ